MISRRNWAIYGMLLAVWTGLISWQVAEHLRVEKAARALLVERARGVAITCGRILRRPGRLVIYKEELESTISQLVRPGETNSGELRSVVLVNRAGNIVATAPTNLSLSTEEMQSPNWAAPIVWLPNLVDLGTNLSSDLIILPFEKYVEMRTNAPAGSGANPPAAVAPTNGNSGGTNAPGRGRFGRGRGRGAEFVRPTWMSPDDFKNLSDREGAHNFFVGMSTQPVQDADAADFVIRFIIALLGTAGVVAGGLAYHSLVKSSDLQLRLVRASEMNLHLKEMNLAAAGLAHETRNPLNIIRGLAQIISKQQDASPEIRAKTRDIIDETDRVTAQLNEFINYSRPREVRRAPTDLAAVVGEVARTLNFDIEEKGIQLQIVMEPLKIEADEQLLRQALFNLVLNAVQAVPAKGEIRIRASKRNNEEAFIEVSDNGPGVPQSNRAEIFKPYFTTHPEGTGLGLSVVQQIVQAHGWEISCLANEPAGALFRIAHVKLSGKD
ncbi:MAG: ATP-binding protein [Verrucomicrobiota bacterium]